MNKSEQYLYGLKMIELYNGGNFKQLDNMINLLSDVRSILLFELKYKFLASKSLIKYVEEKINSINTNNNNILEFTEVHLKGNHGEVYKFKSKQIKSLIINGLSIEEFSKSNSDFIESYYIDIYYDDSLDSNIKEIVFNKYIATDIYEMVFIFKDKPTKVFDIYWYSDNPNSINYLQRTLINNDILSITFDSTKQTNNYFNSYAMEELVKCSTQEDYNKKLTREDILNIKLIYVNLGVASIFNNYKFIEKDIIKLVNLENLMLIFPKDETLEVDISNLNELPNLKEITINGDKVTLKGVNNIIGKKVVFE